MTKLTDQELKDLVARNAVAISEMKISHEKEFAEMRKISEREHKRRIEESKKDFAEMRKISEREHKRRIERT